MAGSRSAHMRIVLATDAWEPQVNGVVRTLTRTVAECRAMGHEVEVIEPSQFRTIPAPTYPEIKLALGAEEEIREKLRALEPEAVHIATEGPIGIATRRICVEWKLPFTTSYHTKFPEYISARFPVPVQVGYAYMKWFHKPSGRLMVATPTLKKELEEHGFKNISPWTRGVDTEQFRPDLERIFHELGGPNDPGKDWPRPYWLNVGRVAVEKNIEAFLETDLPGTKIIVGDGPARAELQAKYPEAKFLGAKFGEELARCFRDADVFVFPSWTDTFGLVILESMAAGTPVAAYPAHGPIDLVPGSNAGAIDEDLRTACLEALKCDRAATRAYAEKFSWRASAEQFVENLEPYPDPERGRFWRRLRRIARVRRRAAA